MSRMLRFAALFPLLVPFPAGAAVTCADVLKALGQSLADVNCFPSADLTTTNTTNDIRHRRHRPTITARTPGGAFAYHRSQRDRAERRQPPITRWARLSSTRIASDCGLRSFLLRLPNN